MMHSLPLMLARLDQEEAVVIAAVILACLMGYTFYTMRRVRETRETEQTKREIAAYVAEGSIKADDAVKLLYAGEEDDPESMIADAVAWGTINPEKAEKLIRTLRAGKNGHAAAVVISS